MSAHTTLKRLEEKGFVKSTMAERYDRAGWKKKALLHDYFVRVESLAGKSGCTDAPVVLEPAQAEYRKYMKHDPGLPIPPSWAQSILLWRFRRDDLEELEGDLQELYVYWVKTRGEFEARKRHVLSTIKLQRPFSSKSSRSNN